MNQKLIWSIVCVLSLATTAIGAAEDVVTVKEHKIYIQNNSQYPVRVAVGPEYPSSIALYPNQVIEFPVKKVPSITASTYGKLSHYFTGLVAELNVAGFLQDHKEYGVNDCFVDITYKNDSAQRGLWMFARYLFSLGSWMLTLRPLEADKDLAAYEIPEVVHDKLYSIIAHSSDSIPESVARDATLIWSMFPRAATKIELKQPVFPFNILGLDVGGLIASDAQLRNWGSLLFASLKKKHSSVKNPVIWDAVHMIIADSVTAIRENNYYVDRTGYLVGVLSTHEAVDVVADVSQEPAFPEDIIGQLKDRVKCDALAEALVGQLEQAARNLRCRTVNDVQAIPIPPAPPAPSPRSSRSFQEKEVAEFIREVGAKQPEEQEFLDKVATELFTKIDLLELPKKDTISLKYSSLDKLRLIAQDKHAVKKLTKIKEFMTPSMIGVAVAEANPPHAMQDWLNFLARVERQRACELAKMGEPALQAVMKEERRSQESQVLLILHLKEQMIKFAMVNQ